MQIHELNTFSGIPGETDFFAVDTGFDTAKISAPELLKMAVPVPLNDGAPDYGADGQILRTKGDGSTEWSDFAAPTDAQVDQAVSDWLAAHPEATTTVQDGSLTLPKFKPGELPFVTPEQYGAEGDGITDDTQAWQDAIDSGYPVKATKKSYKCGTLTVRNNTVIDCGDASFMCTGDTLFDCAGSVVTTLSNESNYAAMQAQYAIADNSYSGYTGIAMLKGTNNFEKSRSYYLGGFICEVVNGRIYGNYPVDVENTSIEIIDAITVEIKNIADIKHTSYSNSTESIKLKYVSNSILKNINSKMSGGYMFISIDSSYKCTVENCIINHSYGSVGTNSYGIVSYQSSFVTVRDCYVFNTYWHAISTGGNYLNYKTSVDGCILESLEAVAFDDHENARGSYINNCVISNGIYISALGVINNVSVKGKASGLAKVYILMSSDQRFALYDISNVTFDISLSATPTDVGVFIGIDAQVHSTSNIYYLRQLNVKNVYGCSSDYFGKIMLNLTYTDSFKLGAINVINSNLDIMCAVPHTLTTADYTDYAISIRDSKDHAIAIGSTSSWRIGSLSIDNCLIGLIQGSFNNLSIVNSEVTKDMTQSNISVSNIVSGSNIIGYIYPAIMVGAAVVSVSNMYNNITAGNYYQKTLLNFGKQSDGYVYWQYWNNGALATGYAH